MSNTSTTVNRSSSKKKKNGDGLGVVIESEVCCVGLTEATLSEDAAVDMARTLSALADPVRLRLLSLVATHGEVCSCDLEEPLGRSQPTISHHTRVLAEAGILVGEKRGRWVWWSLVPGALDRAGAFLRP